MNFTDSDKVGFEVLSGVTKRLGIILFSSLIFFFFLPPVFASQKDSENAGRNQPKIENLKVNQTVITKDEVDVKALEKTSNFMRIVSTLNQYATLIGSTVAVFALIITLYLSVLKPLLTKPKLKIFFKEDKRFPFFHELAFGEFDHEIILDGQRIGILRPGFNSRFKVFNDGKTTARNVQARIEKIELSDKEKGDFTRDYHPTNVKWSGEFDWNPIDIAPKSFFFLDVFFAISEYATDVFRFNELRLKRTNCIISDSILKTAIQNCKPLEQRYWNVWVKEPQLRGIPVKYDFQGDLILYFIINAENCEPIKVQAMINWTLEGWNQPDIRIRHNGIYINEDSEG